jgi:hypothetical protein
MPTYKRRDTGQLVQALPLLYVMRVAQTTPLSLPQWVLSAYREGRMSFSYEASFIRQDKNKADEPVKYPNSYWLVETSPDHLEGVNQRDFDNNYELSE